MKFSLEMHLQKHSCLHSGDSFDSEQQLYKIARNTENAEGNSIITINDKRLVAGFRAVTEHTPEPQSSSGCGSESLPV